MANSYGFRILVMFYEGRATETHLQAARDKGWITDDEQALALLGEPPAGYIAPMRVTTDATTTDSSGAS